MREKYYSLTSTYSRNLKNIVPFHLVERTKLCLESEFLIISKTYRSLSTLDGELLRTTLLTAKK